MAMIILFILLGFEIGLMVYRWSTKSYQEEVRGMIRIGTFVILAVLRLSGVLVGGFRWNALLLVLFVRALCGAWVFVKRKVRNEKQYKLKYVIMSTIGSSFLLTGAIASAILFPQIQPIKDTGKLDVKTVSYTLTDPNRVETFVNSGENRSVTIQFWYPDTKNDVTYPLVVFSHGAFGFRGSNTSTFTNLASNGYVVCSIDHTYHAFFTKQTDGKMILTNMDFMKDAIAAQNGEYDEEKTYELSKQWLSLRMADMNFVLDDTLSKVKYDASDTVYHMIDPDKIGLFGHSLGGATAAQAGRSRSDIDAVIVLDGTMLGEKIEFEDGSVVIDQTPYPVPLLNFYNEEHYKEAKKEGIKYANIAATTNGVDAKEVVFKGAGHINFTGLPMFSPFLAGLLGTGEIDSRYCIETMNQIVLDYFNHYLKDAKELTLKVEY